MSWRGNEPYSVRASSWARLFDCAYAWEGEQLLGMKSKPGLRTHLGTALHASTAMFDSARMHGTESIEESEALFVDTLNNPPESLDLAQDPKLTVRDAERVGRRMHTLYCLDVSPHFEWLSVEQKLSPFIVDCGGGTSIQLTGTMDRARVASTAAGPEISDLKSGSRVMSADGEVLTQGRAAQIGTYQLLYEHTTGQETSGGRVLALHTRLKDPQVGQSELFDAKAVMLADGDSPGLIEYGASMFKSGLFPPNPQSSLCSKKYCARWDRCRFHA